MIRKVIKVNFVIDYPTQSKAIQSKAMAILSFYVAAPI